MNDRSVLFGLYDTIDGNEWLKRGWKNWKTSEDLSHWTGVTVDGEGRVITLDLPGAVTTNWYPVSDPELELNKLNKLRGERPLE